MTEHRILVTGSREWDDDPLLCMSLAMAVQEPRSEGSTLVIVHGACPSGADKTADIWARNHGLRVERHPADWDGYGKRAGFIRNAEMVSLGADLCLAFYKQGAGNKGTDHCARQAENASIPVRRITDSPATADAVDAAAWRTEA